MTRQNSSVLVLMGGTSDEREVSLRSGAAVLNGLKAAGYEAASFDYRGDLPINITADVVFPALHGKGGEDGQVQRQLQADGLNYIGSGVAASELCFNKWTYKQFLQRQQLPVPNGELVSKVTFTNSPLAHNSFVLKPIDGGSSVDTVIYRQAGAFDTSAIEAAFKRHPQLLLEELIIGTEITVGILGETALPVIEIIPPADGEFDYDNKYNGQTQEICPAQSIDGATQQKAQALALQIHKLCGCRDMSRTDMIIIASGELMVLETNTIPGLTNQSLLPKAAQVAGYDFPALVDALVQSALSR